MTYQVDPSAYFMKGMREAAAAEADRKMKEAAVDVQTGQLKHSIAKQKADEQASRRKQADELLAGLAKSAQEARASAADPARADALTKQFIGAMQDVVTSALASGVYDETYAQSQIGAAKQIVMGAPTALDAGMAEGAKSVGKAETIGGQYGLGDMARAALAGAPQQYEQAGVGPNGQILQRNLATNQITGATNTGQSSAPVVNVRVGPDGTERVAATKETINAGQKELVKTQMALDRVSNIRAGVKQEWLTALGRAVKWGQGVADYAGLIPAEMTDDYAAYSAFAADTTDNLNQTIKELSGAAMTEPEAVRMMKVVPTIDDGPVRFKSKLDALQDRLMRIHARLADAQRSGIPLTYEPIFDQSGQPIGQKPTGDLEMFFLENPLDDYEAGKPKGSTIKIPPNPAQIQQMLGKPKQISTDDEYDALPSGAMFVDPSGVTRQKP